MKSSYNSQYLNFKPPLDTVTLPGSQSNYENYYVDGTYGEKQKNIMNTVDDILTNNPTYSGIGDGTVVIVLNNKQTNMDPFSWNKRKGRQLILVYRDSNYGKWAHEEGHIFGLWDLYPKGLHGSVWWWDIMGSGPEVTPPTQHSSFSKLKVGWLKPVKAGNDQDILLTPLEKSKYGDPVYIYKISETISYLIEARDMPPDNVITTDLLSDKKLENGVVVYKVEKFDLLGTMKPTDENKWAINNLQGIISDVIPNKVNLAGKDDPTLFAENMEYTDYWHFVTFSLKSVSTIPYYQPTVRISQCDPICKLKKGLKMGVTSVIKSITGSSFSDSNGTAPDLDLHAVTPEGLHIGMNYSSGEYDMQIPGGVSSGDLMNGEEWIFVPVGTPVRYYVDSHDVQQYINEHPEVNASNATMNFTITTMEYGENPQRKELPDGNWTVTNRTVSEPTEGIIEPGVIKPINVTLPKTGDINGNGQLTLVDAIYLAKHVGGFGGYETIYADGDINANGKVALVDAIYLAKHVGGFIGYEKIY